MKVQPVASPQAIQQAPSTAASSKARAMAAFNQNQQPQQQVVQNQNQIAPEEMGAITAQTGHIDTDERLQEDTQEPTKTPEEVFTEKPVEDPAISRQFAQLARQEKAMRAKVQQQEQAFKAREATLTAREAELNNKPKFDSTQYYTRDQVKHNALDVLAESGVSYEELTQQIISQQPVDPRLQNTINSLKNQIEELKQANEESKKSYADNQTQAYQAAVKQIDLDARNLVKSDPTAYEAITKTGSTSQITKLITDTYNKDGVLLSVEEAATEVENYLVDANYEMATKIEKIKRRIQASAPNVSDKSAQALAVKAAQQTQPMKTLTNATSSTRQLSAKERAILAFKGELKS